MRDIKCRWPLRCGCDRLPQRKPAIVRVMHHSCRTRVGPAIVRVSFLQNTSIVRVSRHETSRCCQTSYTTGGFSLEGGGDLRTARRRNGMMEKYKAGVLSHLLMRKSHSISSPGKLARPGAAWTRPAASSGGKDRDDRSACVQINATG